MRRLVGIGLAVTIVLAGSELRSQDIPSTDFVQPRVPVTLNYTGAGARAMSMGGAYFGISDDASAVSWNPAGLYTFDRPVLSLAWGNFRPGGSFNTLSIDGDISASIGGITQAAFLAPIRIKGHHFVGSINYYRTLDEFRQESMQTEEFFPTGNPDDTVLTRYTAVSGARYQTGGDVFSVGFGTRIYNTLSFGPAVNIYTGKSINRAQTAYHVDAVWSPQDGQYRSFGLLSTVLDTIRYSGLNFTLGLKYTMESMTAGLVLRTPFTLKMSGDYRRESNVFVQDLPGEYIPPVLQDDSLVTMSMPFVLGGGIGYKLTPNLLLAGDVEFKNYSSSEFKVQSSFRLNPDGTKESTFNTLNPQDSAALAHLALKNAFSLRLGSEYVLTTGSTIFPTVPLRAGVRFETLPTPSVVATYNSAGDITQVTTSSVNSLTLAAGTGVQWSQVRLDFGYSFTSYERDHLFSAALITNTDPGTPKTPVNEQLTSKVRDHKFGLTFTGYF